MAFLRFSRDKRGYEHFSLVQPTTNRRGKTRQRVLYWYRTPPDVKVGREPFDDALRRALEAQNPDVSFDWQSIIETPIPSADADKWRERRRAERAARQAAAEDAASEAAEAKALPDESISELSTSEATTTEESAAGGVPPAAIGPSAISPSAIAESATPQSAIRNRKRRRRGGRGRPGATHPAQRPAADGPGARVATEPTEAPAESDEE